jgi:hypothetical protein
VYPYESRFLLQQMAWSGGVYEILTSRALQLASHGLLTDLWQAFPVLVNGVTPRAVIERVRSRFGDVCASTSPESCFGFRFSALEERYLHFDRALGIHYAATRSNGMSYLRNDSSTAFADFRRLIGDRPWLDAAPIPGVSLGQNIFYHEYSVVRRETGDAKFPPIEMEGYLNDLARGLRMIRDAAKRAEMRGLLVKHGWRGEAPQMPDDPRGLLGRLRRKQALSRIGFGTERQALRALQEHPLPPVAENDSLALLEPVRVS